MTTVRFVMHSAVMRPSACGCVVALVGVVVAGVGTAAGAQSALEPVSDGGTAASSPSSSPLSPSPSSRAAAASPPRSLLSLPAPARPAPPDEYRLRRASDGSGDLIYEASGFTARIARDGAVRFRDLHITSLNFLPFLPRAGMRPGVPSLEEMVRGVGRRRGGNSNESPSGPAPDPIANETLSPSTTFSRFRPDPREICRYPDPCFAAAPVTLVNVTGTLDITDELMRIAHQDPYRFQKARFLTATREMRIRMAGRAHAEDLARSGAELPRHLQEIACDDSLSPANRRAIIEALRAELDVSTPEGRAQADRIGRFLQEWDRAAGGTCPPR